jgi:hypothetical protein
MKLMILGSGRHGKDYAAEKLRDQLGLSFISSSAFVGMKAVYPTMKERYKTFEECFNDRHSGNNRALWYEAIQKYNESDPARLARELLDEYDMYVGLRSEREFSAARKAGLFDLAIWVDAFNRVPPEASTSLTITRDMADIVLDNSGTQEQFDIKLRRLVSLLEPYVDH